MLSILKRFLYHCRYYSFIQFSEFRKKFRVKNTCLTKFYRNAAPPSELKIVTLFIAIKMVTLYKYYSWYIYSMLILHAICQAVETEIIMVLYSFC